MRCSFGLALLRSVTTGERGRSRQVRGVEVGPEWLLRPTAEFERLAVGLFTRGFRTKAIEATLSNANGRRHLSWMVMSHVTERLGQECEGFTTRDLEVFGCRVSSPTAAPSCGVPGCAVKVAWVPGTSRERPKVWLHLGSGMEERPCVPPFSRI
jgi:hypothetical protein